MSQWKIQFAQRAMIVALVCIAIATFILLRAESNSIYQGPKYTFPIGSILLMFLTAFVGFVGSVLSFILFLFGWIEPSKKPVYFARTKKTFFVMLTIFILASSKVILTYIAEDHFPEDFTGIVVMLALVFMIMSGIASFIFYLAGWGVKQPRSIREAFGIPHVSRDGEVNADAYRSYAPKQRNLFVGRLGRFFTGLAKFIGFLTIPCALVFVLISYFYLDDSSQGGYIILVGPFVFIYTILIGFGSSIVFALIGLILRYIERKLNEK